MLGAALLLCLWLLSRREWDEVELVLLGLMVEATAAVLVCAASVYQTRTTWRVACLQATVAASEAMTVEAEGLEDDGEG